MNENYPDGWAILKITNEEKVFYRLFGSWGGGYCYGDSWKLNSGITKFVEYNDQIKFHGHSGSLYVVNLLEEGRIGSYSSGVLSDFTNQKNVSTITFEEFKNEFKQIIPEN